MGRYGCYGASLAAILVASPVYSLPIATVSGQTEAIVASPDNASSLDLDPELIRNSPTLQRWLKQVPDVLQDIRQEPSFRTRLRLAYSRFSMDDGSNGWSVGLEDAFVGRTGLTLSADYQATGDGRRKTWGSDLRYYVLPLGSQINLAPVVGYRYVDTARSTTSGLNVGARLLLVPSRTGAADVSLTQTWVAPGTGEEVGITVLSVGYALTHNLRLSTDWQRQNSRRVKDTRLGIGLEWMF